MTKQEIAAIHDEFFASLAFFQEQEMAEGREFDFGVNSMDLSESLVEGQWFNGNDDMLRTYFSSYIDNQFLSEVTYALYYYFETKELEIVIMDKGANNWIKQVNGFTFYKSAHDYWAKKINLPTNKTIYEKIKYFFEVEKPKIQPFIKQDISIDSEDLLPFRDIKIDNLNYIKQLRIRKQQLNLKFITKTKKTMPFALRYLEVQKFRGIEHLKIENLPVDTHWIFLTGENGFGKTSVLQAIANGWIGAEYNIIVDKIANGEPKLGFVFDKRVDTDSLAAYGAARFSMQSNSSKNADAEKSDVLYSLFKDDGNLKNIEFELAKPARREQMKRILLVVIPQLQDILIDDDLNVTYIERDSAAPVTYFDLAAGYRSIIAMIGDMVIRLSANKPKFESTHELQGLVIIDEIDAHLHPKYQKEFVELLTKHFPNIQFIASTHSPIPLLGAPKNTIILTVNRTKESGITIDRVDEDLGIDFHKLQPNALFASPIFGFDDFYSNQITDIADIATEDSAAEASQMERLKQQFLKLKNAEAKR